MTLIQEDFTSKPFIYINGGKLKQSVPAGTPGAIARPWSIPAKGKEAEKSGTKYELAYKSMQGIIKSIKFHDSDYGRSLNIEFDDAILTISKQSRFFADFIQKIASADITQPVIVQPFDFLNDGGVRVAGVTVYQNNEKLQPFFYDKTTKEYKNGSPTPQGDVKKYNSDKWKIYFAILDEFLDEYAENVIAPKIAKPEAGELEYIAEPSAIARELGGEVINVDEIPF